MARIEEGAIERVKSSVDLIALVQARGIALSKHGSRDWKGLCPFHGDEKSPNLIVSPAKGLWHCMACGKAGNAIQFVQAHDGVSFRHAFEVLDKGGAAAYAARPKQTQTTVPVLPCPLDGEADDATLMRQVVGYYHERLLHSPPALDYLASRGLGDPELLGKYQLGLADRSLGLRLPENNRKEGELLRSRLTQLGLYRESGHEHFNGCVVVPLLSHEGHPVSLYGRRIGKGTIAHLYSPGPHRGVFNPEAFQSEEVILCEAVMDALSFCVAGITNVSTLYGTEGFTRELEEALRPVRRVKLAYDSDEAGERAAKRDAERLQGLGMEVWRIRFPWGMDANDYARKVTPAKKSLPLLVNGAEWMGRGREPGKAMVGREESVEQEASLITPAPAPSSLAASVSGSEEKTAKKEAVEETPFTPAAALTTPVLEERGEAWFLHLEEREYRVTGLEKSLGGEHLKIGLRLKFGERFHLDQIDLQRDNERRRFIERAHEETLLTLELLKRDMGKLLLAVETEQARMMKPAEEMALSVELSPEEREAALRWLREPDLIARLREAFLLSGLIGEQKNTLVAYLAGVSRKLERPLAIIIQSASAAGKTTLMDAVLSFFPEEDRVKYSAMTGQSLYYLGESNLKHKILAVVEEAGAEKASYALKLLQSEGELTIASTGKDPHTGRMVTQAYRVEGPVMIFLTTTAIDIDEELLNRCIILSVDESATQTALIHELQRERRTLEGLRAREERRDVVRLLRNAQRLLVPLEVINPYARGLTFPSGRTRNRRDNEKYLTLIDSIALLHQHQRVRGEHVVGARRVEYIEVTLEDIALANELAPEVLGRSLDELPPQTRRLLEAVRALVKGKQESESVPGTNGVPLARTFGSKGTGTAFTFSRKEVREVTGWSLTQVSVHLHRLVELEYIALRCSRMGGPFLYDLLVSVEVSAMSEHLGLIDVEELPKIHAYDGEVSGLKGRVTGGDKCHPVTPKSHQESALTPRYRPDANAHQETGKEGIVA
jgi:DNA primase catalytic core